MWTELRRANTFVTDVKMLFLEAEKHENVVNFGNDLSSVSLLTSWTFEFRTFGPNQYWFGLTRKKNLICVSHGEQGAWLTDVHRCSSIIWGKIDFSADIRLSITGLDSVWKMSQTLHHPSPTLLSKEKLSCDTCVWGLLTKQILCLPKKAWVI